MAVSSPRRRANVPPRRFRGFPSTMGSYTTCGMLNIRPRVRITHTRSIYPPSRAHGRVCSVWRFRRHGGVPTRCHVDSAGVLAPWGPIPCVGCSISGLECASLTHGRLTLVYTQSPLGTREYRCRNTRPRGPTRRPISPLAAGPGRARPRALPRQ